MSNVLSLVGWSKVFSRDDKFKKHHKHCVAVQAYDNLYKRQVKVGESIQKIVG